MGNSMAPFPNIGRLPRHDNFRDAVFGQKLPVPRPAGKQLLNAAVGKGALNRKRLRQLHLNIVAPGEMEAAEYGFLALGSRVTEGQHLAA